MSLYVETSLSDTKTRFRSYKHEHHFKSTNILFAFSLACLTCYSEMVSSRRWTRTLSSGFCHNVCIAESLCQSTSGFMSWRSYVKCNLHSMVLSSIHARLYARLALSCLLYLSASCTYFLPRQPRGPRENG